MVRDPKGRCAGAEVKATSQKSESFSIASTQKAIPATVQELAMKSGQERGGIQRDLLGWMYEKGKTH